MPRRITDPVASFNFQLEIGGITRAGFSEVTGLNSEAAVVEYREGTDEIHTRKLPGLVKFGNVTLKRGVVLNDADMFSLFKNVLDGDIVRADTMSIVLLDEKRQEVVRWNLRNAWPAKWTGPELKANAGEIAMESLEIAHEGVERQ
jgi:phage tail-like protein